MSMENEIKAKSYTLKADGGGWLGQIVITNDGFFSSVTDYGNFSFAWRSFGDGDFREFLAKTNIPYFGGKMYQSISYIAHGRKIDDGCMRFAEQILPKLQEVLKKDIEENKDF